MTPQYEYYDPELPINQAPPNSEECQLGGYWEVVEDDEPEEECDMYEFHSDAGHAWLAVPIHHIEELDIASEISTFSHMNDGIAYLEEDCDAPLFLKAYKSKYGENAKFLQLDQEFDRSPIRNYDIFTVSH